VNRTLAALAVGLALAACTTADGPAPSTGGQPPASTGGQPPASSGDQTGSAEEGVEGSLVTSGLYDATWSWQAGSNWDIGDIGSITLTSDKGTYSSITVKRDGSISFGSAAPELTAGLYEGTGAQVTLGTGLPDGYVCSFTLDNDLTGTDNSVLHIEGTLTFHSNDDFTYC
jgi:hypothetical protein